MDAAEQMRNIHPLEYPGGMLILNVYIHRFALSPAVVNVLEIYCFLRDRICCCRSSNVRNYTHRSVWCVLIKCPFRDICRGNVWEDFGFLVEPLRRPS